VDGVAIRDKKGGLMMRPPTGVKADDVRAWRNAGTMKVKGRR
jgi:hypothetical protein